jgi:CelD/BcsL family acetyltransferase involved in cellulose biosynthesis
MTVDVRTIDPRTEPGWDAFAVAHPAASVFHTSAWCRVLADTYGFKPNYAAAFDDDGVIRAAVPLMLVDSWLTSRRLVGLPFSDLCTPLVADEEYGLAALQAAQSQVDELGASMLEMRGRCAFDAGALGFTNGTNFLRHIIPLEADEGAMRRRLHDSAKRAIKKAEREGITVRERNDIGAMREFYRLTVMTRRKHGLLPQPWRFFRNLHKHLFETGQGRLLLAEHGGKVIAGDLLLRFRDELVYKFNASDPAFLHLRPNNLLLWEAMRTGGAQGCTSLDLGRCDLDNEGLRRFKLLWGSNEETLSYYYYPSNRGPSGLLSARSSRAALAMFVKFAPTVALEGVGAALYGNFG